MLQEFGESAEKTANGRTLGPLSFNQNTVPFDFDGYRLLWLEY